MVEESAREQAESVQAEETAARYTAAEEQRGVELRAMETEYTALTEKVAAAEKTFQQSESQAHDLGKAVHDSQSRLGELRISQNEASQRLEGIRESFSAERARRASIEQILSDRAYTADAVQKLFAVKLNEEVDSSGSGFRAAGLLADYAEVQERYEGAIEQFLREELEYIVVESFDRARAGIALLRDEMGGRATFFVDSLRNLNLQTPEADASLPLPAG